MAMRQPLSSEAALVRPAKLSATMTTGSRNAMPKPSVILVTKDRYRLKSKMLPTSSGLSPVRKMNAFGSTSHARAMPDRNSGTDAARKPTEYQRSFLVSPGVMNAHTW